MHPLPKTDQKSSHRPMAAHAFSLLLTFFIALPVPRANAENADGDPVNAVVQQYPTGSIRSTAQADAALSAVRDARQQVEARYAADESACHSRFFGSNCIDAAQERRHRRMSRLHKLEVEANAFKRQARVAERDKALAERQAREEAKRQQAEREEARPPAAQREPAEPVRKRVGTSDDRQARHEARLQRIREEEAARAQERAENVAAYERKAQDALERQQKVAERKAEKERKRMKKMESQPASPSKPE